MTPERLSQWIHKVVPGGRTLVLSHDQAIGPALVVASWTREDVDEIHERSPLQHTVAGEMLDAAQDHADSVGESCRFTIQWQSDTGRSIRALIHKAFPRDAPKSEGALAADGVSANAMVGQLLAHISTQQKVINGSIGAVLAAYERAMAMQATMLKAQGEMLAQRSAELQHVLEARSTPQLDEQLVEMKRQAFAKVIELGPEVVKLAVSHFAGHVDPKALAEAARVLEGMNGAAAAA